MNYRYGYGSFNIDKETQAKSRKEVRRLIHILWGKAVETPNYDKKEWIDLQNRLNELEIFV